MAPNCAARQETRSFRALFPKICSFSNSRISLLKFPIAMGAAARARFHGDCSERSGGPLANSRSQRVGRSPPKGRTREFQSHGFQTFQFCGATLASLKMLFAGQGIRRVQLSVEKRMKYQFPFRTGTTRTHAGCGHRRRDHGNAHPVAERKRQPGSLTMTLPFMFGWIEHR
jgi:hypothetical protein